MNEAELFLFLKTLIPDLKMMSDQYSTVDCYSEKWKMYIELKCRATHYEELLLEEKKYRTLKVRAGLKGYSPIYINSTPKGIYVFRLPMTEPNWIIRMMPASTQFANTEKVEKQVYFLKASKANKYYPLPK
jgi:hypothetical protein